MQNSLPDLSSMMPVEDGFSHPRWDLIDDCIKCSVPDNLKHIAWVDVERQWLTKLTQDLPGDYSCTESEHFLLLAEGSTRELKRTCKFIERTLKEILKYLPDVTSNEGYGKHIVLKFSNEDDYYRYVMHFYDDGTHPMSGGMCISTGGCLHYAIPVDPDYPSSYRTTLVHELTHGCVSHLPLPIWLNEALAMRMEQIVCSTNDIPLDRDLLKEHYEHWNNSTIQQFWSGQSWNLADQGFQLSYSLAQIVWNKIENEMRAPQAMILSFISNAHSDDAGESACQEIFNLSLGDFIEDFLGEGNWSPHLTTSIQ